MVRVGMALIWIAALALIVGDLISTARRDTAEYLISLVLFGVPVVAFAVVGHVLLAAVLAIFDMANDSDASLMESRKQTAHLGKLVQRSTDT